MKFQQTIRLAIIALVAQFPSEAFAKTEQHHVEAVWINIDSPSESTLADSVSPVFSYHDAQQYGVSYCFSGGRFGDNLVAYFHAKWIAMKYGLPFLYKPFPFSDRLALDSMDATYWEGGGQKTTLSSLSQIDPASTKNVYLVNYFPEFKPELQLPQMQGVFNFEVFWNDPKFMEEVQACMTPKSKVDIIIPPEDCVSVALHVRRGGSFESYEEGLRNEPLKFPPDTFYIHELSRISSLFEGQPLYVHIFTDDAHPESIADRYQQALVGIPLTFAWEETPSHSDPEQIFRDFYSMGNFDCIIHPGSNFSIMASIIGNNQVEIYPVHFHREGQTPVIDLVEIKVKTAVANNN